MSEATAETTTNTEPQSFVERLTTDPELTIFITYVAIIILSLIPIYVGSFKSVKQPKTEEEKKKAEEDSESEEESIEHFSLDDAKQFPFIGSFALLSLFFVYKFFDKKYLNYLITAYFSIIGIGSLTQSLSYLTEFIMGKKLNNEYKLSLTKKGEKILKSSFSDVHLVLIILSTVIVVVYSLTKNWILSNILGLAFSITTIPILKLDSFKTGILLLSALFFYDIFWVFFTPVMVTVAKNFDAPIKLLFPRNVFAWIKAGLLTTKGLEFSMIGLGDIAIPGVFVALCLRFDHRRAVEANNGKPVKQYSKPYFYACFISYTFGLITTMAVMHFFKHAQPALLYLSPACIFSALITAVVRGELKKLFAYNDETEEEKKAREEREAKEKESKELKEKEKEAKKAMKNEEKNKKKQ